MKNAVALGTFDGLHKGHLSVLQIPDGYNKTAVIFKIPPKCIKKSSIELLLTPEEKEKRLKSMGFEVCFIEFDRVENMSAREFLEYIKEKFEPGLISCGFNYRFGHKALGDTQLLAEFCLENRIRLKIASPIKEKGEIVSSSLIRAALKQGEITLANSLLGEDFYFTAQVVHGDGRGKTLGFPTVNQIYPKELVPLKFGVYKTEIIINGKIYRGITNYGIRPTFPLDYITSETFIKDFSGDLYSKALKVIFKGFLREEIRFSSAEELKKQVLKDIKGVM